MEFEPIIRVKFDNVHYQSPVQSIWEWCEHMGIEFDFMGFDTIPSEDPDVLHPVSLWCIPNELDHLAFRLKWCCV